METPVNLQSPLEERFESMIQKQYYDITDGFPFKDSQEFHDFFLDFMLSKGINDYFPVVSIKGRVYLLTQPENFLQSPENLLEILRNDGMDVGIEDIDFTTVITNISQNKPDGDYISAENTYSKPGQEPAGTITYWQLLDAKTRKPIGNNPASIEQLRGILSKMPGVELYA